MRKARRERNAEKLLREKCPFSPGNTRSERRSSNSSRRSSTAGLTRRLHERRQKANDEVQQMAREKQYYERCVDRETGQKLFRPSLKKPGQDSRRVSSPRIFENTLTTQGSLEGLSSTIDCRVATTGTLGSFPTQWLNSTERDEIKVEEQFEQYEEELDEGSEIGRAFEDEREHSGRAWMLGECKEEVEEVLRKHLRRLF